MEWAIVILVAAISILLWRLIDPDERRARSFEKQLSEREPVTDVELHRQYFAADMPLQTPGRVRRIFAEHMDYPVDRILPDDDFMFYWREIDLDDVIKDFEEAFTFALRNRNSKKAQPAPFVHLLTLSTV